MTNYQVKKFKIVDNPKGNIYKIASHSDFPDFIKGEIYFSEIASNTTKGWMRHLKLEAIFGVAKGELTIKIKSSETQNITSHRLSLESSKLISIPPGIWYGFQNNSNEKALIFVILNGEHDKNEIERSDFNQKDLLK